MREVFAISPIVFNPNLLSISAVFSPTPHNSFIGSGCKKVSVLSGEISSIPFGLHLLDANFAINLVLAIPTEQVIPSWLSTFWRMADPISRGVPSRRLAPATSRNASSTEIGSTKGVKFRKISITFSDTSLYLRISGSTKIA